MRIFCWYTGLLNFWPRSLKQKVKFILNVAMNLKHDRSVFLNNCNSSISDILKTIFLLLPKWRLLDFMDL